MADYQPWHPMTDSVDVKTLGKFLEELGECTAASARCMIQGIDAVPAITFKPNKEWLTEEVADILLNAALVIERFGLDKDKIEQRIEYKRPRLLAWHAMA